MGIVMVALVLVFAAPVALVAWWYMIEKPKRGRAMQDRVWRPLAGRLGGMWKPAPGGARFHSMAVPINGTLVTTIVFHRAAVDKELEPVLFGGDNNTWRTFVQADVVGRGPAFTVTPRRGKPGLAVGDAVIQQHHHVAPLLQTPPEAVSSRFTPDVCRALANLGPYYSQLSVGPRFVSLEIPGVCENAALLEAAIYAVGGVAGHGAYPPPPPGPQPSYPPPPR